MSFDSVRIEAYTPHPSEGKPVQIAFNVKILANPFEGSPLLSVSLDTGAQVRFRLYDITGRANYDHLFDLPAGTSTLQLPFSGSAGTYILESNIGKDYQRIHLSSLGN